MRQWTTVSRGHSLPRRSLKKRVEVRTETQPQPPEDAEMTWLTDSLRTVDLGAGRCLAARRMTEVWGAR